MRHTPNPQVTFEKLLSAWRAAWDHYNAVDDEAPDSEIVAATSAEIAAYRAFVEMPSPSFADLRMKMAVVREASCDFEAPCAHVNELKAIHTDIERLSLALPKAA